MNWNPNQGQDPNQQGQYGGNYQQGGQPQQPGGYQPGSYGQPQGSYQSDDYDQQQGGYQPGTYQQQVGYQPQAGYQQAYAIPRPPNPNGPTSMGLDANVAAGLSYLLLILGGLIFYFGEKQNHFVRFNAMQSILLNAVALVVFFAFFILQFIFYATSVLAALGTAALCLGFLALFSGLAIVALLMFFAFEGKTFRLPVLANYADKYAIM
jgi:uncharacterized membrane protein